MKGWKALSEGIRFCNTNIDLKDVHPLVRFLLAARICVVFMSVYSVVIGGLMAWISGAFNPLIFILILIGFVLIHLADNLLNDYSDASKGIDTSGYERLMYAPHPILSGLLGIGTIKLYIASTLIYSIFLAAYLTLTVSPLILLLALLGIVIMMGYSGYEIDLKGLGLGEIGVFIVWGPIMAGGTYLALTGAYTFREALVYTPYALMVSLVLIGKHLDKYNSDYIKRIYTLPIRIGYTRARILGLILVAVSPILATIGIYLYTGSPLSILMIPAYITLYPCLKAFGMEKPREKPQGWNIWPLWYAAWGYLALDVIGRYLIAILLMIGALQFEAYIYLLIGGLYYLFSLINDLRNRKNYLSYLN